MLDEARRARRSGAPPSLGVVYEGTTRQDFAKLDALSRSRIATLVKHYEDRSPKPTGVDRKSSGVYAPFNVRHFHINQNHPDPLLTYAVRPGRFILLAIADHAATFQPTEKFLAVVRGGVAEKRIAA